MQKKIIIIDWGLFPNLPMFSIIKLLKVIESLKITPNLDSSIFFCLLVFCFFIFLIFRATLAAYGSSQARGLIGAAAWVTTTATAMPDLSWVCNLHLSSRQCRILNPLSEVRDQTHVLMDTSWVSCRWATVGTPHSTFLKQSGYLNLCRCLIMLNYKWEWPAR